VTNEPAPNEVTSAEVGFPITANDVTPQWLTDVLRAADALGADDVVTSVTVSRLGAGSGFMGDVARLRLTYAGSSAPVASVVVKSAAPDAKVREMVRGYRNYEREVAFFTAMSGALRDALPRCFEAQLDARSNHVVLVLEDLGSTYVDGDQVAGATYEQARDCLDVLAELHARHWDAGSRAELASVPRVDGDFFVPTMAGAFGGGWAGVLERFPELVPAPLLNVGAAFAEHVAGLAQRLACAPQTLVHSDFRLDNVMFAREGVSPPVKVLDWQGILVSAGVHDVAFLLSQNLADGVRESGERDLVAYYHKRLVELGVQGYDLESLWADYRVAVLLEWVYPVIIGGSLPMDTERSRALFAAMVERSGRAIVSLDALTLLARPAG